MTPLNTRPHLLTLAVAAAALNIQPVLAQDAAANTDMEEVVATYVPAYRGNVPNQERPQAIEEVGREAIVDAGLNDFQSVLDMSATVSRQNNMGGMFDSFAMRGFPGNENMPSGYLINGFSGGRGYGGRRDVSNIENVEIIKGPGSALFGRAEPGGIVNITTLKPEFFREGRIKAEVGSYSHKRVEADITGAISDNMAGRINGAWQDSDSFRDHMYQKKQTISPSLLYDVSESMSVLYEMEYVKQQQPLDRGVIVLNNDFDTIPNSRFLGEPNDGPITSKVWGHQLSLQSELDNGWNLVAGVTQRFSSLEGYSTEAELSGGRQSAGVDGSTQLGRQYRYRDYKATDRSARVELSGEAETGAVVHNFMLGADAYRYFLDERMDRARAAWGETIYEIDYTNPVYGQAKPALSANKDDHEYQQAFGVYVQDQLELTEDLQILLGARVDKYHQRKVGLYATNRDSGTEVSPRLGVTYALTPEVQVYASYSEGFMPLTGSDYQGNPFDPEKSKSREVGVKINDGGWITTVALFDAEKSNILTADPVNGGSAQLGGIQSRGLEFDTQGYFTDTLSMTASYAWLDTSTTEDVINADWGVEVPAGSDILNVPANTLSVSLKQELVVAGRDGYVGGSYQYVDDRLGDTINPDYRLPAYWLVNVNAGVNFVEGFAGQLSISNLFNKDYMSNSYNAYWTQPGEPRTVKASVTYSF